VSWVASDITDDMIERGAKALTEPSAEIYSVRVTNPASARRFAEQVLEAALAGRTVVELPEPNADVYVGQARSVLVWDTGGDFTVTAKGGSFGARVNIRGGPYLTADAAEARAVVLLAAVREARRLAGSVGSETPAGDRDV
jgi:hypothetical protein